MDASVRGWGILPDASIILTLYALMSQFFPTPPPAALNDIDDAMYGPQLPFSLFTEEVAMAVVNLSPFKAPGPSGIPNAALKECSGIIVSVFTNILNRCIELGHHPAQWKFFMTITLRKPGKPSYLIPKTYCPIMLEDTLSKVMESVVARHLAAIAKEHHLLPPNHFGGRPQHTGTDAILHLVQRIKDSWHIHKVTFVLYLNISSALPSVNHHCLLHNLRKCGVPKLLVQWIANFLTEHRTQLTFNNFTSEPLLADCSISQGSPLSPILYLFYSSDLLELIDPKDRECASLGYIDDTSGQKALPPTSVCCQRMSPSSLTGLGGTHASSTSASSSLCTTLKIQLCTHLCPSKSANT